MNGDSELQPVPTVSVIDPLARAIDWARDVLFRPFSIEKWIVLGFCAWLSMLGQNGGGGGGSSGWRGGGGERDFERGVHEAVEWVLSNLLPILIIGGMILTLVLVIWLLCLWLSSRGKFMFLDGVVNDRGAVVEPWRRFRSEADSLFLFRIVLGLACFACIAVLLAMAGWLVWLRYEVRELAPLFITGLVLTVLAIVLAVFAFVLIRLAINDFLVPLMYLRRCGVGAAWRELGDLISARPGAFALYVIVKIFLAFFVVAVSILACCLTCCIAALPFVGTVILLPLWVFLRAYPLYFVGQFGPAYARFATLGPQVEPSGEVQQ